MSDRAGEWVTIKEAARLLGVHYSAVPKMVRRGDLAPRPNQRPSLSRKAVLELRDVRAERARVRAPPPAPKTPPAPPDDEHDWVDAAEVAAHLNVGVAAVHQRARRGRLPFTLGSDDRTRFYRLDLVDMAARAQEATRTKELTGAPATWSARPRAGRPGEGALSGPEVSLDLVVGGLLVDTGTELVRVSTH